MKSGDRCSSCDGSLEPCRNPTDQCKHYLRWLARHPGSVISDEEIMRLARENTFSNGSHEFCNYVAFARAVLAWRNPRKDSDAPRR